MDRCKTISTLRPSATFTFLKRKEFQGVLALMNHPASKWAVRLFHSIPFSRYHLILTLLFSRLVWLSIPSLSQPISNRLWHQLMHIMSIEWSEGAWAFYLRVALSTSLFNNTRKFVSIMICSGLCNSYIRQFLVVDWSPLYALAV